MDIVSTKKVKFDPLKYETEIIEDEDDHQQYSEAENDLDLDTIKASRNKSKEKELKEFDSEGSEGEEAEVGIVDNNMGFNTDSEGSENDQDDTAYNEDEFDEREIPIEPFNLRQDREEGSFDSDGNYVRKIDEEADQDRWMSNFTRADIIKARKAYEEREKQLQQIERSKSKREQKSLIGLYEELVSILDEEENEMTVQQVISSLSNQNTQNKDKTGLFGNRAPLNKNRLKKLAAASSQESSNSKPAILIMSPENKLKLDRITEIVDALMDLGNFGVYEESRREILSKLENE